ncbi:hypothetical protein S83_037555 [Arachis hypogaea]
MWGTIANLKENLNKIALDVHDDDDDDEILSIYAGSPAAVSDRRNSHGSAHSKSPAVRSRPLANGTDHAHPSLSEIEQYKAEIKRLQASEAEIKALSVNYAALLKEKEDHIVRLNKENGSLKQHLDATSAALRVSRTEASTSGTYSVKGSNDQSPNRQNKFTTQSKTESKNSNLQGNEKELADLVDGRNRPTADAVQHTAEIEKLKLEMEQERARLAKIQLKCQEEQKLNKSFQEELKILKLDRDKTSMEMTKIRDELNEKVSEIKRLQIELTRRESDVAGEAVDSLKRLVKTLEKENATLKMEKNEIEAALETSRKSLAANVLSSASQMSDPSKSFPEKEEMERSIQKLNKDLMDTQREKEKAVQELTRLKQHLLEKEAEESEKMDQDIKIIEDLRQSNDYLRAQVSNLERTLKQAVLSQEELKMANNSEVLKSREIIDDLDKKLSNCIRTIDAKNHELLNLQTALGQYYAEIEAKEHLEGELVRAREETARLTQLLRDAENKVDVSRTENEKVLAQLAHSEKVQTEWRSRVVKLEEDNSKVRRALEQSMMQLNRMSLDSDYLVDRRIVIKLLVTYFQRNHSKEVLDLMVRMLGFSDEDKQRIGAAQQGGKVRGVLGLPGRLVGGILRGSSTDTAASAGSNDQSIADLWVDFLLKETEEREKRESSTANTADPIEDSPDKGPNTVPAAPPISPFSNHRLGNRTASAFSINQKISVPPRISNFNSEFSTVPLTPSDEKPSSSDLLPRF